MKLFVLDAYKSYGMEACIEWYGFIIADSSEDAKTKFLEANPDYRDEKYHVTYFDIEEFN